MQMNKLFFDVSIFLIADIFFLITFLVILLYSLKYIAKFNTTGLKDMVFFAVGLLMYQGTLIYQIISFNELENCNLSLFYLDITYLNLHVRLFIIIIAMFFYLLFYFYFYDLRDNNFKINYPYIEFILLTLISVEAMQLLIMSNNLFTIYLLVELQSLCYYVLPALKRDSNISIESALKYFINSSYVTVCYLFGCTIIYYLFGTLNVNEIILLTTFMEWDIYNTSLFTFGIILILSLFFFKLALYPFHNWLLDIYEGSNLIVTSFFAILPKISIIALLLNLLNMLSTLVIFKDNLCTLLQIVSCLTIVFASTRAVTELTTRRLFAYSSMVNIGYIVLGMSTGSIEGYAASLNYLILYTITNLCLFTFLTLVRFWEFDKTLLEAKKTVELVRVIKGSLQLTLLFTCLLFSMAGIPPFGGFFVKLPIFTELFYGGQYIILILVIFSNLITAFYYIRLIRTIAFSTLVPVKFVFWNKFGYLTIILLISFFFIFFYFSFYGYILNYILYIIFK